jgi:Transposase DDE domain
MSRGMESTASPFAAEVLRRLPLAEAFYTVWGFLASDALLADLFDRHRGRCYEDQLTFAELVRVLADALTRYQGRGRGAILDAVARNQISCQARAVYGKLARLPLPLAEAFLTTLTQRLRPLLPATARPAALPASLGGLAVVVVDGKKIKRVAKRLLPTRNQPGKLYGGKLLVAYLPAEGVAVAVAADVDGEANDIRSVPHLLPTVREVVTGPRLWVADRQFCDLIQPRRFADDGDHFVIRYSNNTGFHPDPTRAAVAGTDADGRRMRQEWGWLGAESQGERRLYVRRVTLTRPGDEDVAVVTDLRDEVRYPAADLLAVYLTRWQIENVFQQITEVFHLQRLIGCRPPATVFQASLCLVLFNVLQLVRGYVAAGRPEPTVEAVSGEQIFADLTKELVGLHEVLTVEEVVSGVSVPEGGEALRNRLRQLLGGLWSAKWAKVRNRTKRPEKPPPRKSGGHTSVHKLLQAASRPGNPPPPEQS